MKKLFFLCLLALSATVSMAQTKYLLRFRPVVGETVKYANTLSTSITMPDGGAMQVSVNTGLDSRCLSVEKGLSQMEYTFTNMTGTISVKGTNIDFPKEATDKIIGKRVAVKMDSLGKAVGDVDASDLQELAGLGVNLNDINPVAGAIFPSYAVGLGDTWEAEVTTNGMELLTTFKVVEVLDKALRIEGKADLKDVEQDVKGAKMKLSGTMRSQFITDIATGMVRPGTMSMGAELYMTMPDVKEPMKMVMIMK